MAEIHLQGVSKVFDKTVAVDDVELHIDDGEFMVLLGPSGCGKTTLLRLLAGLEYPNGGRVRIGDADVTDLPPRKRDLAMVFQSYTVFPHLKVSTGPACASGWSGPPPWSSWASCWTATRPSCPAANASGWRSPGRS
jgi:ABC-type sugar transport system ATPase subunit